MYSFLDVIKRPVAGFLTAALLGFLASVGVSDAPDIAAKVAEFSELFVTIFVLTIGDIFKRYLQQRERKKAGVVSELLESNRVSSLHTHV